MALYENGKRISGIRDFPAYTWAAYHALPVAQRPKVWKCTDRDYTEIPRQSVSVTADGVKTHAQLFNELWSLCDLTKLSAASLFRQDIYYYNCLSLNSNGVRFGLTINVSNSTIIDTINLSSASGYTRATIASGSYAQTSYANTVPTSGSVFYVYY